MHSKQTSFRALRMILLAAMAVLAISTAVAQKAKTPKSVVVKMQNGQGQDIGTATLSKAANGVKIKLNLHDLPPVDHGIHIHQTAKCDGPDFKSAGGHFNPENKHHGLQNPEGPHAGDMPNFTVGGKGTVITTIIAPNVTLGDDAHSIFSNGGTALVIHAKADDGKTDPAGNAGDRIACGLITK